MTAERQDAMMAHTEYLRGLREAAEIARRWVVPGAQGFNESMINNTATMVAEAIEAKAGEKP